MAKHDHRGPERARGERARELADRLPIGLFLTDADGRCRTLLGDAPLELATYNLRFEIAPYFVAQDVTPLYPYVEIAFAVTEPSQHYHIPLLLTANGYTTYRGS